MIDDISFYVLKNGIENNKAQMYRGKGIKNYTEKRGINQKNIQNIK